MFGNIKNFFKKLGKNEKENSKSTAKERLHLVLAQDRANISADFLEMMKQEIIEVIKKYIDIDEEAIDVKMTNKPGEDGTVGAPALYANIPIVTIKNEARKLEGTLNKAQEGEKEKKETEKEVDTTETSSENSDNKEDVVKEIEKEEDNNEENTDEDKSQENETPNNEDNKEEKENLEEEANEEKNA